jgi:low temperature requirement protein LtrA
MARDSYTYLHLPMVAGIVLLALGGKVLLHEVAAHSSHISPVAVAALYGGTALYLLAHIGVPLAQRALHQPPAASRLRPASHFRQSRGSASGRHFRRCLHLSTLAALLVVLVIYEVIRFAGARDDIRHAQLHG